MDAAARELEAQGWTLRPGWGLSEPHWDVASRGIVCTGVVSRPDDVAAPLLAAARGAGLLVAVQAESPVVARLFEDLARIGQVEYRREDSIEPLLRLDPEQRRLVELLAAGRSLDEAAHALNYSRRTVTRRLAKIRSLLRVRTTAEAVVMARREDA
jgi:DNA-binding NarL/FixJ family response regulator